jgi:hypothetical protein
MKISSALLSLATYAALGWASGVLAWLDPHSRSPSPPWPPAREAAWQGNHYSCLVTRHAMDHSAPSLSFRTQ